MLAHTSGGRQPHCSRSDNSSALKHGQFDESNLQIPCRMVVSSINKASVSTQNAGLHAPMPRRVPTGCPSKLNTHSSEDPPVSPANCFICIAKPSHTAYLSASRCRVHGTAAARSRCHVSGWPECMDCMWRFHQCTLLQKPHLLCCLLLSFNLGQIVLQMQCQPGYNGLG